jgi:hypothetical protein
MFLSLLGIQASAGVGSLHHTNSNADTVSISTRIGDTSGDPDRPGIVNAVWAGNKDIASELKVSIVDFPTISVGILRGGLSASGISSLTLSWFLLVSGMLVYTHSFYSRHTHF